ncbi:hypothetical protein [Bradyrhizobium yuanmingense]|uniref:hypothetical protein n=1 Tax=Bradyrhizobium yuanmingense TaxID=108015 RepID=UPI0023B8F40D|nr:hypothetical protein [Bradyrhizobium yuanmingense]MDF0584745.1 hypothetical protein [Bradyrhizobium yuanmingense]
MRGVAKGITRLLQEVGVAGLDDAVAAAEERFAVELVQVGEAHDAALDFGLERISGDVAS